MFRVVIVDADKLIAKAIEQMNIWHVRRDFTLVASVSGEEQAMEFLQEKDANILCIVLNGRNIEEFELIRCIRRRLSGIHIILIGDDSSYEKVRAGFVAGVFDYLLRPLSEEQLNDTLSRISEGISRQYVWEKLFLKVDALIKNIFLGGENIEFICESIVEQIYADWENDAINGQVVEERAKKLIYEELTLRKPWLKKFIYDKSFTDQKGFRLEDKESIKREWKRDFTYAAKVVKKYQMLDHKLIYHIGKYVVVHVDEPLTLEEVSKGVYLNKSYISHIFKKTAGIHFVDFLIDVKIDRAKILLMNNKRKIQEVAEVIGYKDSEYFSKVFKKRTGFSPSQYREYLKT